MDPSPYRAGDAPVAEASCFLCGLVGAPGSTCPTCQIGLPTAEDADIKLREGSCPRCRVPLLAIAPDMTSVLHVCSRCRGMFVPSRAWHVLLTSRERAAELEAKLPPSPLERGTLIESVACPVCSLEMDRHAFGAISEIVIDACPQRHGVWLDAAEIGRIVEFTNIRAQVGDGALHVRVEKAAQRERHAVDARAATELKAALARRDVPLQPHERSSAWPAVLLVILGFAALSGGLQRFCGSAQTAPSSTSPAQSAINQNAASSERALNQK